MNEEEENLQNKEMRDALSAARAHAWEWFKYHASQRMTVFNFFLLITAALTTGFVTTVVGQHYLAALALAAIELIVIASFFQLDRRNSQLVKIGERYLDFEERRLAELINNPSIRFVEEAERKPMRYFYSFRQVIQVLFVAVGFITLIGIGLSLYGLLALPEEAESLPQPDEAAQG